MTKRPCDTTQWVGCCFVSQMSKSVSIHSGGFVRAGRKLGEGERAVHVEAVRVHHRVRGVGDLDDRVSGAVGDDLREHQDRRAPLRGHLACAPPTTRPTSAAAMSPTRPRCLSISLLLSVTTTRSLPRRYSRGGLLPNKCRPYIRGPQTCQVKTRGFLPASLGQIDEVALGPPPLKMQVLCRRADQPSRASRPSRTVGTGTAGPRSGTPRQRPIRALPPTADRCRC